MLGSAPSRLSFGPNRRSPVLSAWAAAVLGGMLAFSAPAFAAQDDLQGLFSQGMAALDRGEDAAALAAFRQILALDPSREDAYELWRSTDHRALQRLLMKQGQFEVVALRLMGLAREELRERQDDPEAIRGLLAGLEDLDPIQRRQRVSQLRASHGEFAVPPMLGALADESDQDRRVITMISLAELGSSAVPPLIEALGASSAYLRRNVALTLGRIGDARAAGALALLSRDDPDGEVRGAAQEALAKLGQASGAPEALLVAQGEAYLAGELSVLDPYLVSPVVWSFRGGRLEPRAVPSQLYGTQMARGAFLRALTADPANQAALGGLARAGSKAGVIVQDLIAAGGDESALQPFAEEGSLLAGAAGPGAFSSGLERAMASRDYAGAVGLLRHYASTGVSANPTLAGAIDDGHPQVRGEAALALAAVALRGGSEVPARAIGVLGETAGREIVRTAVVIDPNGPRAEALAAKLRGENLAVAVSSRAAQGLLTLRQLPGVDLIVLADEFPDMTADQLLKEIGADLRSASAARLMLAGDAEAAGELYGERVAAVAASIEELPALDEVLGEGMNRDRAEADSLSQRAAQTLANLAQRGQNISDAVDGLARTLASRPEPVVLPAVTALATGGTVQQVPALLGLLADGERSEGLRVAAADALAAIFARGRVAGAEAVVAPLQELLLGADTAPALRQAAARAMGALELDPALRAETIRLLGQPLAQE
jgi:HEAT repeat protein